MNSKILSSLFLLLMIGFLVSVNAEGEKKEWKRLNKILVEQTPIRSLLNINSISTVFKNDGISDIDRDEQASGVIFPKGSGKTACYQTGLLWGGKAPGDPQVRLGGTFYSSGLQGGKILNSGLPYEDLQATTNEDPLYRIYRVRKDVYPGGPSVDLSSEINSNEGSVDEIRSQYEKDWNEWPAQAGAPFEDKNGNGVYEPAADVPGIPGADQTVWCVANDLNSGNTRDLYGTQPMGMELQMTYWAYNRAGALGNMFFRKYILINKSNVTYDSMYVSIIADVDLGNASDDYVGCDTTLSLGYSYNAAAVDATYSPLPPPAIGFDFFQGPLVAGVAGEDKNKNGVDDAADYGSRYGNKVGPGWINLPMTSFFYFAKGDANVVDPTRSAVAGATEMYNFFQGRVGKTGQFFVDPITGQPTTYVMPGDPTTSTGWLDGRILTAGDRRQGQASGPFTMAPSDTQEVVVAEIVAGAIPGVDRLSAVGLLKFYDKTAQDAFDNNFDLPVPPPAPEVNIPGDYDQSANVYYAPDKKIVLDWGENQNAVNATEQFNSKGYIFEGYNIYQLPTASASVSEGVRIATFDVANNILKVEGQFFDITTGSVAVKVQQFGNDTGIKRYLEIRTDALRSGVPLVNGNRYYFAVTAYAYNPTATISNLENPLTIYTIIPTSKAPGVVNSYASGDTLTFEHTSGVSEGLVIPIVVDPTRLTGDSYKVTFDTMTVSDEDGDHSVTFWSLTNTTKNQVIVTNQTNVSGDDNYPIVDGILVKVTGPPTPGMKGYTYTGTRTITFAGAGDGGNWGSEGYSGAIGNAFDQWFSSSSTGYDQLANIELRFATTDLQGNFDPSQQNVSYGYRYMRGALADPARPEFAPYILNKSAGYSFQEFAKNVPLAAYNMETNPPTRLAVGFLENNKVDAVLDGKYFPRNHEDPLSDNIADGGPREWLYIFNIPYSETQDPQLATDILNTTLPIMWFLTVNRRFDVPFTDGDTFTILANHINTVNDAFAFTAPKPEYNVEQAKADVEKVNVFPNPYYGVNPQELNKYNRFVTFSHLPGKATIRIFNLAGITVKEINKDNNSTYQRWDLANDQGMPVASGLYIAYIDMPELGKTKILKFGIVQEQQILDRF